MATPQPPYSQPSPPPPGYYPPGPPPYYPVPPPVLRPPQKKRWVWWLVAAVAAGWMLLVVGIVALVIFFISSISHNIGPARDATNEYFAAIKAHDWVTAQDQLSASLRATVTPADLQATWTRREQADGPIDHVTIGNTSVNSTNGRSSATVGVTLYYAGGASDPKIVTLVKEAGIWKLSRLP
jgi:hypothetical protein